MRFIEVPSVLAAPTVESSASSQVTRKLMQKRLRADMCFSPRLSLRTHFASSNIVFLSLALLPTAQCAAASSRR